MRTDRYPILEFDPEADALIEPVRLIERIELPPHAVACFFQDVIAKLVAEHEARPVAKLESEIGESWVYEIDFDGQPLTVFHPGVGAPLAAAFLEEVIALGCTRFIACGGAGVLRSDIAVGHVVVPYAAVRDEGTSYHYLAPSREVEGSRAAIDAIVRVLEQHNVSYLLGKTWTTDAIYRETRARIERRKNEGCITVEMEAAAFFAVAKFRGVEMGQLLYGGDDLGGSDWDSRRWTRQSGARERLFWLAAEACLRL